jgi:hypothetical protein
VIPGLFQTPDYCAAMLSFWSRFLDAPNDLEEAVAVRMERQRILYQRGKRFAVILEEQALRTWFGDADTQANQLDRLLTVMALPTVALGVIPLIGWIHASIGDRWNAYVRRPGTSGKLLGRFAQEEAVKAIVAAWDTGAALPNGCGHDG